MASGKWGCKVHYNDRSAAIIEWGKAHPGIKLDQSGLPEPAHEPDCPACRLAEIEHRRCDVQRAIADEAYTSDGTTGFGGRMRAIGREGRILARAKRGFDPGSVDSRLPAQDPLVEEATLEAARIRLGLQTAEEEKE